jgi:hypothetical protein
MVEKPLEFLLGKSENFQEMDLLSYFLQMFGGAITIAE